MSRLLIIEDEKPYRELLLKWLSGEFDVDTVSSMRDASRCARDREYDAVILDIGLPDAMRETVVAEVKSMCPSAAVMVLSGYDRPEYIRECILGTVSNYLVKGRDDINPSSLIAAIRVGIASKTIGVKIENAIKSADRM